MFASGAVSAVIADEYFFSNSDVFGSSRAIRGISNTDNEFVDPLLLCGISEDMESKKLSSLEEDINNELNKIENENIVSSVYFRELSTGLWLGINEDERYSPASLLKVPLMITYLKLAETFPEVLDQQHVYNIEEDANAAQNFKGLEQFESGESYSIRKLLELMIVQSDNNAKNVLDYLLYLNSKELAVEIYNDLGLKLPEELNEGTQFMSVKMYSYFFRILYNASYLNDADSNDALELMSHARFPHGIAASIPEDIKVSQKFGERKIVYGDVREDEYELHDCGIIYFPGSPYLLCVMTKGGDSFEDLSAVIKGISQVAYNYVKKQD